MGLDLGGGHGWPRWAPLMIVATPVLLVLIVLAVILERRQRLEALDASDIEALEAAAPRARLAAPPPRDSCVDAGASRT